MSTACVADECNPGNGIPGTSLMTNTLLVLRIGLSADPYDNRPYIPVCPRLIRSAHHLWRTPTNCERGFLVPRVSNQQNTPRLLVYRPLGAGAVNITRGDLERLHPGKYLNDTLIEFGLKCVLTIC